MSVICRLPLLAYSYMYPLHKSRGKCLPTVTFWIGWYVASVWVFVYAPAFKGIRFFQATTYNLSTWRDIIFCVDYSIG